MKIQLFLLVFILISCVNNQNEEDVIIFGIEDVYKPFSYIENGELQGFDIDLGREIAKKLNKKVKFHVIVWDDMIQELNFKKVDLVASVSATNERQNNMSFSKPYYFQDIAIIHQNNLLIHDKQELQNTKIACVLGTIFEIYLKKNFFTNDDKKLFIVDLNSTLFELLKAKYVDFIILEEHVAKKFVENDKRFSYTVLEKDINGNSFALKKNSPLLPEINEALDNLKQNGMIKKLENKWFQ